MAAGTTENMKLLAGGFCELMLGETVHRTF